MKIPAQTQSVFCKIFKGSAVFVFSLVSLSSFANAQEDSSTLTSSDTRRQAVYYRNQGLQLQDKGDLDGAMTSYKKAVDTDPSYALAYNDMGVVHEARGMYKQAEQNYLKAAETDPMCAGAYSNLALLKEEEHDLEKARIYWKKRADAGDPNDPWTIKAREKVYGLGSRSYSFDSSSSSSISDELKTQARFYREEGMKLQNMGNLTEALSKFMKAQQLDPTYATVYNDMGVIYETQGQIAAAEECYKKAIDVDPSLPGSYSNLALLYESTRDLKQALYFWKKRQEFGGSGDSWTEQAVRRVRDIRLVLGNGGECASEGDVMSLVGSVVQDKEQGRKSNTELSKQKFTFAKERYKVGDEVTAFKKSIDAGQLDPKNEEVTRFTDKVERRLLSQ